MKILIIDELVDELVDELNVLIGLLLVKESRFAELRAKHKRVEKAIKRARALAERTRNEGIEAEALRIWGSTLGDMGELAEAAYFLEESVKRYRSLKDERGLAITLNALGGVYLHDQNLEMARRNTEEALRLHTEAGNRRGSAFSISQLGNIHYFSENFAQALHYLQQALEQFEGVEYSLGVTRTANNVGYIHWRMGAPDAALPFLKQSLQIARQMGIQREEGNTHESLGSVYRALGQYSRAERSFQRTLEQAKETGWQFGVVWGNVGLGLLYQETEEFSRARDHLQRALNQAQLLENEREVAICMGYLGALLAAQADRSDARDTVYSGEKFNETKASPGQDEASEALQQLKTAVDLLLDTNSPYEASPFLVEQARLLLELGQLNEAGEVLTQVRHVAHAADNPVALHEATLLSARLATAQGNKQEAQQQIHAALAAAEGKTEQADFHRLLWLINGSLFHAQQAHGLYTEIYAQRPLKAYQRALDELEAVVQ